MCYAARTSPEVRGVRDPVRIAFVYRPSWKYYSPHYTIGTRYSFFFRALARSQSVEVGYFASESSVDASKLAGEWDVILCTNSATSTPPLKNASCMPVIAQTHDPHLVKELDMLRCHDEYKIDCCFNFMPESYFYKYFPKRFMYKVIRWGLEADLFSGAGPFEPRIKDRVLLTGKLADWGAKKRAVHALFRRGFSAVRANYELRRACATLPGVDYSGADPATGDYLNGGQNSYAEHLWGYRAAIAASGLYPTAKYWETPAAGCLTFMEATAANGAYDLGYKDMESAVFISSKNYEEKITRYLESPDDPRWAQIAEAGRHHATENLSNDRAVEALAELAKSLV